MVGVSTMDLAVTQVGAWMPSTLFVHAHEGVAHLTMAAQTIVNRNQLGLESYHQHAIRIILVAIGYGQRKGFLLILSKSDSRNANGIWIWAVMGQYPIAITELAQRRRWIPINDPTKTTE